MSTPDSYLRLPTYEAQVAGAVQRQPCPIGQRRRERGATGLIHRGTGTYSPASNRRRDSPPRPLRSNRLLVLVPPKPPQTSRLPHIDRLTAPLDRLAQA
jgi:hypothetical protein